MGVYEKYPRSGVWYIRYSGPDGKIHKEAVGAKGLAKQVLHKRKTEVREGKFFPKRPRDWKVSELIDDYLQRNQGRLAQFYHHVAHGKTWKDWLDGKTASDVTPADIQRYVTERLKTVKPATVNRELAFLKRVFNDAIENERATSNPVERVKLLKENNARVRFLAPEEEERLLRELKKPEHKALVIFALVTGLRQSEQFGLKISDISDNTIYVRRSKHGGARTIPLSTAALQMLNVWRMGRGRDERVFPVNPHNFYNRVFKPALKRAGVENFHWHDLRHTFASRLVMKGVDLRTVQELLGHKTLSMTLRYSHLAPGHLKDAIEKLTPQVDPNLLEVAKAQEITGFSGAKPETENPCVDSSILSLPTKKFPLLYFIFSDWTAHRQRRTVLFNGQF